MVYKSGQWSGKGSDTGRGLGGKEKRGQVDVGSDTRFRIEDISSKGSNGIREAEERSVLGQDT